MWILYLIGIVLLIMFAKSMILNPILFKKKWQAVLGYGVPGIICLLLFFGAIFLEYNAQQAYFKDQSERIATSNWQPPTVSGNVTPVKATTANSNYVSIPVTNNSDLQKGLNDLQEDLNDLQNSIDSGNDNPVVASTANAKNATPVNNDINVSLDNRSPRKNSTINLTVTGTPGSKVTAICNYKTTTTSYTGVIGNNGKAIIPIKIGTSTSGFPVNVDVTAGNAKAQTSFTAQ
ncbi:hypothetical protein [Clostridium tyrobutyricum]|uniref:hypothetical protein n=1 Tax=Clostridium tyrobutyricum TaxID=1519 RepID=UPI002013705F|nr:hypothetical protein [Clostridium tyrobutyricum]MBR9648740.1 hypothetical protein [Clostridium tyrobutyricum]